MSSEEKPVRILLTCGSCNIGGIETQILHLMRGLKARGHDVEAFFFSHGPFEAFIPPEVAVHFGTVGDLLGLLVAHPFDVLHGIVWDLEYGLDLVKQVDNPPKLVLTSHGSVCPGWTSANCDAIVCCGRWLVPFNQKLTDLPVQAVLNAINVDQFVPFEGEITGPPVVAWVGRASDLPIKRIDRFAPLAPAFREAGCRVWVASPDAPEKVDHPSVLKTLVPAVESWRNVPPGEMADFYRSVAATGGLLLMTSDREGLPGVLIEAQACGCPVVAPRIGGTADCVSPDRGGTLYDHAMSPEKLVELVLGLVADREAQALRGAACAAFAQAEFRAERMAREYEAVYMEAPYTALGPVPWKKLLPAIWRYRDPLRTRKALWTRKCEAAERVAGFGYRALAARILASLPRGAALFALGPKRARELRNSVLTAQQTPQYTRS